MENSTYLALEPPKDKLIKRDNIINTMMTYLNSGVRILYIEGDEGIGKTTLTEIFHHKKTSLSLLIKLDLSCKWGSDLNQVKYDIYSDLYKFYYEKDFVQPEGQEILDSDFSGLLNKCKNRLKNKKQDFYIIVDGLTEIDPENAKKIFYTLPLSSNFLNFKIIMTGNRQDRSNYEEYEGFQAFPLPGFSEYETNDFFAEYKFSSEQLTNIYKTSEGNPGYLASIKRRLDSGELPEKVLANLPENLPKALTSEWKNTQSCDLRILKALTLVACGMNVFSSDQLAEIFQLDPKEMKNSLNRFNFIVCENENVKFITESFRRFAVKELEQYKVEAYMEFIEYLVDKPDIAESIGGIPKYLYEIEKYDEALEYLTDDMFAKMIKETKSFKKIRQDIQYGVLSALNTKALEVLIGHSLKSSAVESLTNIKVWESELEALMSLGDYDSAVNLASMATMVEDRFHAYAQICKHCAMNDKEIDPLVIDQLKMIYDELDKPALGERAVDIAQDIQFFDPLMAIDLIKSSLGVKNDPNATDYSFTMLALSALDDRNDLSVSKMENYDTYIQCSSLRKIAKGLRLLKQHNGTENIISSFSEIEDFSDKITLIRQWISTHRKANDAVDISLYGLELVLGNRDYSSNARVFYDLVLPLEYTINYEKSKKIISIIIPQLPVIKSIGPIEDYYNLYLMLSLGEITHNLQNFFTMIDQILEEISLENNLIVKANTLSRILATIALHCEYSGCARYQELEHKCKTDLDEFIIELLDGTANNYEVMKTVINNISLYSIDYALGIIDLVNTQYRRDWLYISMFKFILTHTSNKDVLDRMISVYDLIDAQDIKDELIVNLLVIMLENRITITDSMANVIKSVNSIRNLGEKCFAYTQLACYQIKCCDNRLFSIKEITDNLAQTWKSIDENWQKIEIGFKIVASLAKYDKEVAQIFLNLTDKERSNNIINTDKSATAVLISLLLTIRAFSGLLVKKIDTSEDLDRILNNIGLIPSENVKLQLYADLAHRAYLNDRNDILKRIVQDHINPIIEASVVNSEIYQNQIIITAPVLFFHHHSSTIDILKKIPEDRREECAVNIIKTILTNKPVIDPIDRSKINNNILKYEQVKDVIELMPLIKRDYIYFDVINELADLYMDHCNEYSREQKADMEAQLNESLLQHLPDPKGIQHDGYIIAIKAQLTRMFNHNNESKWKKLIEKANRIPNKADKCFVLGIIYGIMPQKMINSLHIKYSDLEALVDSLPTSLEKASHYTTLAQFNRNNTNVYVKQILEKSMRISLESESKAMSQIRKEMINLAYNINPDLAASLASLADEDPARANLKRDLNRQLNVLKLRQDMFSVNYNLGQVEDFRSVYPMAAWSSLASLNSNRIPATGANNTYNSIKVAASLPLEEAYPIYSCVIENLVVKYKSTDQSKTILRPIFVHLLSASEIVMGMTNFVASKDISIPFSSEPSVNDTFALIQHGQKEKAKQFFMNWLESSVSEILYICDQYFTINDIEWLFCIQSVIPDLTVIIVSSKKKNDCQNLQEEYKQAWRNSYQTNPLPVTFFLIDCGDREESFLHDRWCLSEKSGLDIGTSFNGLGMKESKLKIIPQNESDKQKNDLQTALLSKTIPGTHEKLYYEKIEIN